MKKYVRASLLSKFLEYHDDENNYARNPSGFDAMYSILEKYDTSNGNDTVDIAFQKASREDQEKMVRLITPSLRVGEPGYAFRMYQQALENNITNASTEYCNGVVDAFAALFAEGLLSKYDF